jgi:hypothetical protein
LVRDSDAPDGNVQIAMPVPWSSVGRNPLGSRSSSHAIAATIAAYGTIHLTGPRSIRATPRW